MQSSAYASQRESFMIEHPSYRTTVLCVDIGGTSTKAGLLDGVGHISFIESIPTGPNADQFVTALCQLIDRTIRAADAAAAPRGIGVAIAGFLDAERTNLAYNPNLPWLEHVPLKERIAQRFGFPIELEMVSDMRGWVTHALQL